MPSMITGGLGPGGGPLVTGAFTPAAAAVALSFRQSLAAALKASPAVAAVVGNKVFPVKVPESQAGPWVLYHVQSVTRTETLAGPSGVAVAVARVGCGSKDQAQCVALSEAVRDLFDGFTGPLGGPGGLPIQGAHSLTEADVYEHAVDGSDAGTYWTTLTYSFRFRETVS